MDDALSPAMEADREEMAAKVREMAAKVLAWYTAIARVTKWYLDCLADTVNELFRLLRPFMARYLAKRRVRISRMHRAYSARRR